MAMQNQKPISRGRRIVSIAAWSFVVLSGVFELVVHRERGSGIHGLLTGLGVVVGIMCIFGEVTGLLQEPR